MFDIWIAVEIVSWAIVIGLVAYIYSDKRMENSEGEGGSGQ